MGDGDIGGKLDDFEQQIADMGHRISAHIPVPRKTEVSPHCRKLQGLDVALFRLRTCLEQYLDWTSKESKDEDANLMQLETSSEDLKHWQQLGREVVQGI